MSKILNQLAKITGRKSNEGSISNSGKKNVTSIKLDPKAVPFFCGVIFSAAALWWVHAQISMLRVEKVVRSDEVQEISPNELLIQKMISQGDWSGLAKNLEELEKSEPLDGNALSNLGFAYHKQGKFNEARLRYQAAVHKSEDPRIILNLALLEWENDRSAVTLVMLKNLNDKGKCIMNCKVLLGMALEAEGEPQKAIEVFQGLLNEGSLPPEISREKVEDRVKLLHSILIKHKVKLVAL